MKTIALLLTAVFMTMLASTADCEEAKKEEKQARKSMAKQYTIEPGASIYGAVKGRMDIVDTLVKFVKAHGNRCDSVSAASDNMLSKGYELKCNGYNYTYQILDKGGKWQLRVE